MKKVLVFLIISTLLLCFAYAADIDFKDISDNHWAREYVYKIVELGVTRGYPDGTFRGKNTLNRYEIAVFLAKLAESLESKIDNKVANLQSDNADKLLEELRAELKDVKADIKNASSKTIGSVDGWSINGKVTGKARINYLTTDDDGPRSKQVLQRGNLEITKALPNDASFTLMYDTDYMDFDGTQDLPIDKALSVIAKFKVDDIEGLPFDVEISSGPGLAEDKIGDPIVGVEDMVKLSTTLYGFDVLAAYIQMSASTTLLKGEVKTSLPIEYLGPTDIKVGLFDYFTGLNPFDDEDNARDIQAYVEVNTLPVERIGAGVSFILGEGFESEKLAMGAELKVNDYWKTGTYIHSTIYTYGEEFFDSVLTGELDEYQALKINAYGKWIGLNGVSKEGFIGSDFAIAVTQKIDEKVSLFGGLWLPFTKTFEDSIFTKFKIGVDYAINNNISVKSYYSNASYSDGAIVGLNDTSSDFLDVTVSMIF